MVEITIIEILRGSFLGRNSDNLLGRRNQQTIAICPNRYIPPTHIYRQGCHASGDNIQGCYQIFVHFHTAKDNAFLLSFRFYLLVFILLDSVSPSYHPILLLITKSFNRQSQNLTLTAFPRKPNLRHHQFPDQYNNSRSDAHPMPPSRSLPAHLSKPL